MVAAGLRGGLVPICALSLAYGQLGSEGFKKARWRNIAYAIRYGKGCGVQEALSMDMRSMSDLIDAIAYCVEQEAKAVKRR